LAHLAADSVSKGKGQRAKGRGKVRGHREGQRVKGKGQREKLEERRKLVLPSFL
jgi:hypothetical protein